MPYKTRWVEPEVFFTLSNGMHVFRSCKDNHADEPLQYHFRICLDEEEGIMDFDIRELPNPEGADLASEAGKISVIEGALRSGSLEEYFPEEGGTTLPPGSEESETGENVFNFALRTGPAVYAAFHACPELRHVFGRLETFKERFRLFPLELDSRLDHRTKMNILAAVDEWLKGSSSASARSFYGKVRRWATAHDQLVALARLAGWRNVFHAMQEIPELRESFGSTELRDDATPRFLYAVLDTLSASSSPDMVALLGKVCREASKRMT